MLLPHMSYCRCKECSRKAKLQAVWKDIHRAIRKGALKRAQQRKLEKEND